MQHESPVGESSAARGDKRNKPKLVGLVARILNALLHEGRLTAWGNVVVAVVAGVTLWVAISQRREDLLTSVVLTGDDKLEATNPNVHIQNVMCFCAGTIFTERLFSTQDPISTEEIQDWIARVELQLAQQRMLMEMLELGHSGGKPNAPAQLLHPELNVPLIVRFEVLHGGKRTLVVQGYLAVEPFKTADLLTETTSKDGVTTLNIVAKSQLRLNFVRDLTTVAEVNEFIASEQKANPVWKPELTESPSARF